MSDIILKQRVDAYLIEFLGINERMGETPDPRVIPGRSLARRYYLIEPLANGGMATVWRAEDRRLRRTVAVKILDPRLITDPVTRTRLRTEARTLAQLAHPHIAHVYDYGTVHQVGRQPLPYLVMELVHGESLAETLARDSTMPWPAAVRACAQVARALAAAHAHGIVHRDVAPGNVLLTPAGVKVIDFGICASTGDPERRPDGAIMGTPAYLAPERMDGLPVSPAVDVYALGVLLFQTLSGRLPWHAESALEMVGAHRYAPPEPLPDLDGLPGEVTSVYLACLAKKPEDRPDAAEVARILAAAVGDTETGPNEQGGSDAPHPPSTGPLATSDRTPNAGRFAAVRRRARVSVLAGSTMIFGALAWTATHWPTDAGGAAPQLPVPSQTADAAPPGPWCRVSYRVTMDTGNRFNATIAVASTKDEAESPWQVSFEFPHDQRIDPRLAPGWLQDGTAVASVAQSAPLPPHGSVHLAIAGSYTGVNALPTRFQVNGAACRTTLVGPTGSPVPTVGPAPAPGDPAPQPSPTPSIKKPWKK